MQVVYVNYNEKLKKYKDDPMDIAMIFSWHGFQSLIVISFLANTISTAFTPVPNRQYVTVVLNFDLSEDYDKTNLKIAL